MLVEIPLNDDEWAAVEGDEQAVGRLIDLVADVATPAGAASSARPRSDTAAPTPSV